MDCRHKSGNGEMKTRFSGMGAVTGISNQDREQTPAYSLRSASPRSSRERGPSHRRARGRGARGFRPLAICSPLIRLPAVRPESSTSRPRPSRLFPTSLTYIAELGSTRVRWGKVKELLLATHQRPSFVTIRLLPASHDPEKWCPVFGQDHAQERGGEAPEDAISLGPRRTTRCRHLKVRERGSGLYRKPARLPALRLGTRHCITSWFSSSPCFLGRGPGGRYPPFPVPVQGQHIPHRPLYRRD